MSQAGIFEVGNPGVADVQTLTGNDGLIVVPDGAGNINVVGDDVFIQTTRTGANTLTISPINTAQVTATTIGAVTANLATLTLNNDPSAVFVTAHIIATYDDYSASAGLLLLGAARRAGGGAILVGLPDGLLTATDFGAGVTGDFVVSGNTLILQVTGAMGATINWQAQVQFQEI
jgi:hypothetical protein